MMAKRGRSANFEILRVIAMLMIVFLHYYLFAFAGVDRKVHWNAMSLVNYILFLCHSGVGLFVLISGYFMSEKQWGTNWKGLFNIWFRTFFYGTLFCLLLFRITPAPFSFRIFLQYALPLTGNQYWFITDYIALLLISPFLALLSQSLSRWQFTTLMVILPLFGLTVIMNFPYGNAVGAGNGYTLLFFIILYLVGAYIRKYDISLPGRWRVAAPFAAMLFCFLWISFREYFSTGLLEYKNPRYNDLSAFVTVAIFLAFKDWKAPDNVLTRSLVALAPYAFGIYLIHEQPHVRYHLWFWVRNVFHPDLHSAASFPICIGICLAIFALCAMVDCMVGKLMEWVGLEAFCQKAGTQIDRFSNRVVAFLSRGGDTKGK